MKVFQAYVEYKNLGGFAANLNKIVKHHGGQYHVSPIGATKDIAYFKKHPSVFKVLHSEVLELDVPDTLSMEGVLKESGEYEDHHVYLEDDEHMTFTIDTTIRNHFLGRKIKITVELDEE